MKLFEISSKANKKGKRKFKVVLYRIHPDSCVDEINQVGTMYNLNGITWIREYCEKALPSIVGMSLRCEFIDDERTEIRGHGETGIKDDMMTYENAVVLGTFTKGYIDDIQDEDGETITVCIGEGEIDAQCYHNFVTKLDEDLANGYQIQGSVEISRTEDNDGIIYKYGYKDKGRIPMVFEHSGYALLGVLPADENAMLIELNKRHKEDTKMSKEEMQALVAEIAAAVTNAEAEIDTCKNECNQKIAEINAEKESVVSEKSELEAKVADLETALAQSQQETKELYEKLDTLYEEQKTLREALGEAKAKERLAELTNTLADYTVEEQNYAKDEIEAFKQNPTEAEINSVVSAILLGIGKAAKENEKKHVAEQNSQNDIDIFGSVQPVSAEDDSIF